MLQDDQTRVEYEKVSPERPTDERRPDLGTSLDVSDGAERRADDALSDFGSAAITRRWRRDDAG